MEYYLGLYEKALPSQMSIEEKLKCAKRTGFDGLEISIDESDDKLARLDWTDETKSEWKTAIKNTGVPILTMCLSAHRRFPLGAHQEAIQKASVEILEKAIKLSEDLGIRIIQLAGYDVYYEKSDSNTRMRFLDNVRSCVEMAARRGILLGFETMETPFIDTVSKAMAYVKKIDSPYLGIYPDIGNLKNSSLVYGTDLLVDLSSGSGHILAAHLKETQPGVYRNLEFGNGHTEYVSCIRELYHMGVRIFTAERWYQESQNTEEVLLASSAFLRKRIEKAILTESGEVTNA